MSIRLNRNYLNYVLKNEQQAVKHFEGENEHYFIYFIIRGLYELFLWAGGI